MLLQHSPGKWQLTYRQNISSPFCFSSSQKMQNCFSLDSVEGKCCKFVKGIFLSWIYALVAFSPVHPARSQNTGTKVCSMDQWHIWLLAVRHIISFHWLLLEICVRHKVTDSNKSSHIRRKNSIWTSAWLYTKYFWIYPVWVVSMGQISMIPLTQMFGNLGGG